MEKTYSKEFIKKLTDYFYKNISDIKVKNKILLEGIDKTLVKQILFSNEKGYYSFKPDWMEIYEKIDFSNISFDNVSVAKINFKIPSLYVFRLLLFSLFV